MYKLSCISLADFVAQISLRIYEPLQIRPLKNFWDNLVQNSHLFQICAKQKCDSDKNENVEVSDLRNSRDPMESKACNANERLKKRRKN